VGADMYGDLSIVESANNTWTITFTVTEIFNDGTSKSVEYSFDTAKNSKGEVVLNGVYKVVFDIAGNGTNIKAFYFVLI
jgi:hypothetical protein